MEDISKMRNFVAGDILCIVGKEGFLGAGSFGVVRCVFHRSLGWIAVKCFPVNDGMSACDVVIQEIQNELSALQQANHENIIRVYGWAQWEGSIAMVTELMQAGSLRVILGNSNVPLYPVLRLRMCKEISDGIAFIHNFRSMKRLTHGDLKPENILLTIDLRCKVGDLGSAKVINLTGQTTTTTTTDATESKQQMTRVYAAPERLRKSFCRPKKEQDTYSYGIIVYEVLSRETPTENCLGEQEFLEGIKSGERPETEAIDELEESLATNEEKEIIQVLRSVMIKCWQDKPTDRPDMTDVRDQLQQLMSKQKPSDVSRSMSQAQEKMTIFSPMKSEHRLLPLNYFNPQTRKFQDDEPRDVRENRNIKSSIRSATIVSTDGISSADATSSPRQREDASSSTASATISSTANPALSESVDQLERHFPKATISSDAKRWPDMARKPLEKDKTDSSAAAATISLTMELSTAEFPRADSAIRSSESLTRFTTIVSDDESLPADTNQQPSESVSSNMSTSAATISSAAETTLAENSTPDNLDQMASLVEAATISTDKEHLPGEKGLSGTNRRNLTPRKGLSGTPGRKPTLKEAFINSNRSRLPEQVKEAPDLLEKYKNCLATGKMEEAKSINNKIISIIKNEINTTEELLRFADDLRLKAEHPMESIPFYVASASLCKKEGGRVGLKGMRFCVGEMLGVNEDMVRDDVNIKPVVRDHVIPLMRHIKDEMETVTSVDEEAKCEEVVRVLRLIGKSEELIDELDVAMETYKERLERVKKTFGNEAKKRTIYGDVLEDLGDLYKKMSRFGDATSCYQQAIEVYKAATDVDEEEWRKSWIKRCEKKLREVQ